MCSKFCVLVGLSLDVSFMYMKYVPDGSLHVSNGLTILGFCFQFMCGKEEFLWQANNCFCYSAVNTQKLGSGE